MEKAASSFCFCSLKLRFIYAQLPEDVATAFHPGWGLDFDRAIQHCGLFLLSYSLTVFLLCLWSISAKMNTDKTQEFTSELFTYCTLLYNKFTYLFACLYLYSFLDCTIYDWVCIDLYRCTCDVQVSGNQEKRGQVLLGWDRPLLWGPLVQNE